MIDESVDRQVVDALARVYEVHDIASTNRGVADEVVLGIARELDAVLVTADKDFGELVYRQKRVHRGVVLTRLSGMESERKAQVVVNALSRSLFGEEERAFVVISPNDVRVRPTIT